MTALKLDDFMREPPGTTARPDGAGKALCGSNASAGGSASFCCSVIIASGVCVAEASASHSVIVETATGYRTDDRKQRRIMLDFAEQSIKLRRRARLPVGIAKRGRRAGEFTIEDLETARKIWFSKKYASDQIAGEHLPAGMTVNQARTRFKSSGRPPGRKPQQKRRKAYT